MGLTQEKRQGFKKVLGIMPEQNDKALYAIFKADSLNRFYVPAVMMDHDQPGPASAHTVHILGADSRSRYLTHSLQGVYDSVQTILPPQSTRYANIVRNRHRRQGGEEVLHRQHDREAQAKEAEQNNGHISNLVVAGPPSQTLKLLGQVKHRVDDRTAICLMQDGLGVAEAASNQVFTNPEDRPSLILGHMTHSLALDRNAKAVHSMKPGSQTALTSIRPYYGDEIEELELEEQAAEAAAAAAANESTQTWLRTQGMLSRFAAAPHLHARGLQLHSWLSIKIPSLMFSSVADPICVLLDARYEQLMWNKTAKRLVSQLLNEIADVVALMPELRDASPGLQAALRGEAIRKHTFGRIRAKKDAPSRMVQQIERGEMTDIDYLNGYFVERGKQLGLSMQANEMVLGMVKAKHRAQLDRLRSYIPFETGRYHHQRK